MEKEKTKANSEKSIFEKNIERGVEKGILQISENKKKFIYLNLGREKENKSFFLKL